MQREDRAWALSTLGLTEQFMSEDLDRACVDMQALWAPHLESANPKAQEQGKDEIAKIVRAKQVLLLPDLPIAQRYGMKPVALGVLVAAAFVVGFGGMYLYRVTHPRNVSVVIPKSALASAPRVHLNVPDVTVSSQRLQSPEEARRQADQARVNQDLAGFGGDDTTAPIEDLTSMGPRAVPGLTAALSARDSDVRKNAAAVLNYFAQQDADGSQGYRQAFSNSNTLDALSRLSEDEDSETRQVVAETLGNMGDGAGIPTLDSLSTDADSDVRMAVVTSLGKLNSSDSIATLTNLLSDDESSIRQGAAEALGKFVNIKEAHDALVDRLPKEYDEDVKRAILAVLGLPTNIDERDL